MAGFIIKDSKLIPIITIPYLLILLVFNRDTGENILSMSIFTLGVIIYRILKLESVGIIIIACGIILCFCLNRNYNNGKISFIAQHTNPPVIRCYDGIIAPFKKYPKACKAFKWTLILFWTLTLIFLLLVTNETVPNLILSAVVTVVIFVISYYLTKS